MPRFLIFALALVLLAFAGCALLGYPFACNPSTYIGFGGCTTPQPDPNPNPRPSLGQTSNMSVYDFHPAELSQASTAAHPGTHRAGERLCTVGFVESSRRERDGDRHVWTCETAAKRSMPQRRAECVLGEIVPRRPLPVPSRGTRVRMCGEWVEADAVHGWTELHPVISLEAW